MNRFLPRERGATAVEYALFAALIAGAIALAVGIFGVQVNALFASLPPAIFP